MRELERFENLGMATNHKTHSAVSLLAQMFAGISLASEAHGDGVPDFSAGEIAELEPVKVGATLHLPSGDTYSVTVEWLEERSP